MSSTSDLKPQRILIAFTGGGTGGHVYPNIAVKEALAKRDPQLQFIYFGSNQKIESKVCSEEKINFVSIPLSAGMPRTWKAMFWLFKFFFSFVQSYFLLLKHKPTLIFGTGGYIAAPVFLAAGLLKIPYIVHNLDAHMGLANAAFIKDSAALTLGVKLNTQQKQLPKDGPSLVTGNPVRENFYNSEINKSELLKSLGFENKRRTVIITGGSQGAQHINELIINLAEDLIEQKWQIIHQLGPKQYDLFFERFPVSPFYKPEKYLNNLHEIYAICDMAIARSGAMSVAELMASQVPSIFIPLPTAAQNHQFYNAKAVESLGAGYLLEQKDLNAESLKKAIEFVFERRLLFKSNMQKAIQSRPADTIADLIQEILHNKKITTYDLRESISK